MEKVVEIYTEEGGRTYTVIVFNEGKEKTFRNVTWLSVLSILTDYVAYL